MTANRSVTSYGRVDDSYFEQLVFAGKLERAFNTKIDALGILRIQDAILPRNAEESKAIADAWAEAWKESRSAPDAP